MGIRLSQEMEGEVFRVSMRLLKSRESNWNRKILLGLKMPAQCVGVSEFLSLFLEFRNSSQKRTPLK